MLMIGCVASFNTLVLDPYNSYGKIHFSGDKGYILGAYIIMCESYFQNCELRRI